jgi:NRPS condensation-like uncharacterized protein
MRRKLSAVERLLWLVTPNIAINFAVTVRVGGHFSADELRVALAHVRARHPLLGVRIAADAEQWPCLASWDVPELSVRIVPRQAEDDWVALVEQELARPFDRNIGPLVRFVWLRSPDVSELIVVCDHLVADGLSAAYLVRDILRQLGQPDAEIVHLPELPTLNELIPPAVVDELTRRLAAAPPSEKPGEAAPHMPPAQPAPIQMAAQRVLAWALTEPETTALVARCRAEGTTVQAAICAAFLLAFAEDQPDAPSAVRRVQSPFSVRGRLARPVADDFGLFVAMPEVDVECAPNRDFWDIARDIRQALARETADERIFMPFFALEAAAASLPDADLLRLLVDSFTANYDISVTNLGRLDIPAQYGPLRLEALYGPALSVAGEHHRVLGVTTVGGRMSFTLAFCGPSLDHIRRRAMLRLGAAVGW